MAVDELPTEVGNLLDAAGVEWPFLNEGALCGFVRALRGFRMGMLRIHLDATDSLARIAREQHQEGAEETLEDWDGHAAAFVFGVAAEIEAFCGAFEEWVSAIAVDKASVITRLRELAAEAYAGDIAAVDEAHQATKDLVTDLETKLHDEAGVMLGERLEPLLSRIAQSSGAMGGTSALLRGEGTFARGADLETVYMHIDRFRTFGDAMQQCSQTLIASMRGLDFGAPPGPSEEAGPVPADEPDELDDPAEAFAVWRGHRYRAERVSHSAVRLSLLPGDTRPPAAPELGGWPYTGSLLLWPAQLDAWVGPAVPGKKRRADLLETWRMRFAEEAFRYFTPVFGDTAPDGSFPFPDGDFVVGEFARWRGRIYGAQSMPDDSARLFPLPGDDRTPVVPDLARHARGLWASPIELEEWYAVCTTFYVADDAYVALSLSDGTIEGMRAYTPDPVRERFSVDEIVDLQEERRDLLAEWKWKAGI